MSAREATIQLPEELYEQFAAQAKASASAVDRVITQILAQQVSLANEAELPSALQAELRAMNQLSVDALWIIARSNVNADKLALYDLLVERQRDSALTPEGHHLLHQLREELDAVTLRKSHAYALLHSRGIPLPSLDELRNKPQ